jgi:type II secretory pathway pseudopilin PulG
MSGHLSVRRTAAAGRHQGGFSLFEFGVVAAIFALLVGIGANRLLFYQREAQTVAAEQLIVTLRSALQLRVAQLRASQRDDEIAALLDENPIAWLAQPPPNYLGEYYSPDTANLAAGNWYFERRDRQLVFLLTAKNSFSFRSSILLKFKVESLRIPTSPAKQVVAGPVEALR